MFCVTYLFSYMRVQVLFDHRPRFFFRPTLRLRRASSAFSCLERLALPSGSTALTQDKYRRYISKLMFCEVKTSRHCAFTSIIWSSSVGLQLWYRPHTRRRLFYCSTCIRLCWLPHTGSTQVYILLALFWPCSRGVPRCEGVKS